MNAFTSADEIAFTTVSNESSDKIAIAVRPPTPLTLVSLRKNSRSRSEEKP